MRRYFFTSLVALMAFPALATTPMVRPGEENGVSMGAPQPACIVQVNACSGAMLDLLVLLSTTKSDHADKQVLKQAREKINRMIAQKDSLDDVTYLNNLAAWIDGVEKNAP